MTRKKSKTAWNTAAPTIMSHTTSLMKDKTDLKLSKTACYEYQSLHLKLLPHRRFPAVLLRIYFTHGGQRELPSLPCSTPAPGVVAGATTFQNGGRLLLLCLGVGQGIHEPWHTMCTHTHSLLPVCQEGHYRTPGERGSGLLEIVEIRGMLEVRGREERGEKKWEGSPL